ncbi:MAG: rod shape-determining protein MreC [Minisyncoccia bacterium]
MSAVFFKKRERIKKVKRFIFLLILLIIIIIVLNLTSFSKQIKNFFFFISAPVQEIFQKAGKNTADFLFGLGQGRIIKQELEQAHLKNQELLYQIANLQELKKENEELRKALGINLEKDEYQLILAQLVSSDISRDVILINKGKRHGVVGGSPVITSQKVLIGRISQVYDRFSEVILISNKKSSFDAKIMAKEIYGLVKGKDNFEVYLDLIPKDAEIAEGDLVVTAALSGFSPADLLVGEIKSVKRSDVEAFQQAEIKPLFDISNLDYLFIVNSF